MAVGAPSLALMRRIKAPNGSLLAPAFEVFDEKRERTMPLALFPADRQLPNFAAGFGVQVRLKEMELHRPRQWGACWLACHLYEQLGLDEFWAERLPDSREGTCWGHILQTCFAIAP